MKSDLPTLEARLVDVLAEGGARKYSILLAIAEKAGHTEAEFEKAIVALRMQHVIVLKRRRGGVYYDIVRPRAIKGRT